MQQGTPLIRDYPMRTVAETRYSQALIRRYHQLGLIDTPTATGLLARAAMRLQKLTTAVREQLEGSKENSDDPKI